MSGQSIQARQTNKKTIKKVVSKRVPSSSCSPILLVHNYNDNLPEQQTEGCSGSEDPLEHVLVSWKQSVHLTTLRNIREKHRDI
jgi:hypothetical protein